MVLFQAPRPPSPTLPFGEVVQVIRAAMLLCRDVLDVETKKGND
jgi:hypothetical protein